MARALDAARIPRPAGRGNSRRRSRHSPVLQQQRAGASGRSRERNQSEARRGDGLRRPRRHQRGGHRGAARARRRASGGMRRRLRHCRSYRGAPAGRSRAGADAACGARVDRDAMLAGARARRGRSLLPSHARATRSRTQPRDPRLVSRPSKDYRPTLDGWRAIAILLVIFAHGGSELFYPGGRFASSALYSLSLHGVFGVDLFFGISGLLICGRLLDEREKTGGISLHSFYIRRVFRILPPAFAYLAIVGLLAIAGFIAISPREWLSSVFFSRNYIVM